MRPAFLQHVLQAAENLAAADRFGTYTDADLWRCFRDTQDEAAFALIVRRHGALVWGVCRHVLGNEADAEDAFQATFLAFLRNAKKVQKPASLGSWFHGVAYRVALKAKRTLARRRQHEGAAATTEANAPVSDATWNDLQTAVHEEVHRLPETLRTAFVLCCLQGTPQQDAAAQLGWKIGTLSGRLTKARQTLLERLTRRGVALSVAAGSTVLAELSSASVPAGLLQRTLGLSTSSSVPVTIMNLAQGVTAMYFTRNRLLLAAAVVLGLLTTGFGTGFFSKADAQTPTTPVAAKVPPKMFWEYKLIPQDKDYTEKEFLAFLSDMEAKGSWEYAGTQTIRSVPDPKAGVKTPVVPHMVFKRRIAIVATDDGELRLGLESLAERKFAELLKARQELVEKNMQRDYLDKMNKALVEALKAEDAVKKADALKQEDTKAELFAKAKLALAQAEAEFVVVQAELERAQALVQAAGEKLSVLEKQYARGLAPQEAMLNAKRDVIEADKNAKVVAARLEVARAARNRVKADMDQAQPPAKSNTGGGGGTTGGGTPKPVTPPTPGTSPGGVPPAANMGIAPATDEAVAIVHLKYIAAGSATALIKELFADNARSKFRIVADEHTNSLLFAGPKDILDKLCQLIETLDVKDPKAKKP